jgi:hypothetical protein
MGQLAYRGGSKSDDNFTPRWKDTQPGPGVMPGLSLFLSLELAVQPGAKAQVLDLDLLVEPLRPFHDDPSLDAGQEGHLSIAPADSQGMIDRQLLEEWARSRGTNRPHRLTQLLKDAIVGEERRSQ